MSRSLQVAALCLLLGTSLTLAVLMPNPNQPHRERRIAELRRSMKAQQGPPQQGGGGGGGLTISGQSDSTQCTTSSGSCATDGSTNYVSRSLTYDTTYGTFNGTMVTNLCSNNAYGFINHTQTQFTGTHTADCKSQTFPAPDYTSPPKAAPLLGNVGYSLYGVNMYGPFEAGFTTGQACTNGLGDCAAGVDVGLCEKELEHECGTANVNYGMLMDTCGGHAAPYHYHTEMLCDDLRNKQYTTNNANDHAPLIGIALDGRGIYGRYESGTTLPTDLDACGGHWGVVPGSNLTGVAHAGGQRVYHYHTQENPPFLLGCYGPVSSLSDCRTLYSSTCGSGTTSITTASGTATYDTDCPCYDAYGNNLAATSAPGATTASPTTSDFSSCGSSSGSTLFSNGAAACASYATCQEALCNCTGGAASSSATLGCDWGNAAATTCPSVDVCLTTFHSCLATAINAVLQGGTTTTDCESWATGVIPDLLATASATNTACQWANCYVKNSTSVEATSTCTSTTACDQYVGLTTASPGTTPPTTSPITSSAPGAFGVLVALAATVLVCLMY